jgi:hypothetical protein
MPGIASPARSKTSAGPKRITKAIGRAFLPFARPAIAKRTARTTKKAPIAVKTEVNLGILAERNSDISISPFSLVADC